MDLETALHRIVGQLLNSEGFRLPIHVASLAANGASLFTRFEAPPAGSSPGAFTSEHVSGDVHDEGFLAPIHILVKDATGRIRLARQGPSGTPVFVELADDSESPTS